MRKMLIVANWKMNMSCEAIQEFFQGLLLDSMNSTDILICPPAIYIQQVAEALSGTEMQWGLQNVFSELSGAFTGEISSIMARDIGCTYVIIGHSERRNYFSESDDEIASKFCAVADQLMNPILCVGETEAQRDNGETMQVISRQIESVLRVAGVGRLSNFTVAYEPVWAIGTGETATPEQAQEVHAGIRQLLSQYDEGISDKTRILYGGSVNSRNAASLMSQSDIDGGLIGTASLDLNEFKLICNSVK